MTLVASVTFIIGVVQLKPHGFDQINEPTLLIAVGAIEFAMFFPWFTCLYFARHFLISLKRLERENAELRDQLAELR